LPGIQARVAGTGQEGRFLFLPSREFRWLELLGLIALVVVLASILIINGTHLAESARTPAAAAELQNVQAAVALAMTSEKASSLSGGTFDKSNDLPIGQSTLGSYLKGGNSSLRGSYRIGPDGSIVQIAFP
jgi:hypothetical protein